MTLDPGYGETPLPFDELDALTPAAREALEEPIAKAAVYDLEQAVQAGVSPINSGRSRQICGSPKCGGVPFLIPTLTRS